MIIKTFFVNTMYIIFGAGITGLAIARYLKNNNYEFIIYDQNPQQKLKLQDEFGNKFITHENNQITWSGVVAIVVSPGVDVKNKISEFPIKQAIESNVEIINDIELFWRFNQKSQFIAITGTNGKSTTTSLTNFILKQNHHKVACGGNIGIGCFELPNSSKYLLELSSYQLEVIKKARINIASLINISCDHLDRHKTFENYIAAKKQIFLNQQKDDFALINIDNPQTLEVYKELMDNKNFQAKLIPISNSQKVEGGFSLIDGVIYYQNKQILLPKLHLKGDHNQQNIIFAFAITKIIGLKDQKIIDVIAQFSGLKYRMDFCKKIKNINFINDSKATNVESTKSSLKTYDNIFWILGGQEKGDDILDLAEFFPKVKHVFLIGQSSNNFAIKLENKIPFSLCKTLEKAFLEAYKLCSIEKEEVNIIFSPACASFDQWQNFEHRGDAFYELIKKVKHQNIT